MEGGYYCAFGPVCMSCGSALGHYSDCPDYGHEDFEEELLMTQKTNISVSKALANDYRLMAAARRMGLGELVEEVLSAYITDHNLDQVLEKLREKFENNDRK